MHLFELDIVDIKRVFADMIGGVKYFVDIHCLIKKLRPELDKPELPTRLVPENTLVPLN
jgi:hypothetical protein